MKRIIEKLTRWLAKVFGVSVEPPFEIADSIDIFVRDKLNLMLEDAESWV